MEVDFPAIAELDALPADAAAHHLRTLFEEAPRFLGRLAAARPFGDDDGLVARARRAARSAPREVQIELLDAHPRIGATSSMSRLSRREQGLDRGGAAADHELQARFDELNGRYEARFGFRYVIFVAGRPRAEILPLLEAALGADPDTELTRGLEDVVRIAADRLAKLRAAARPRPTIGG